MGKSRKAIKVKPLPNARNAPLPTQFSCLFCNHDRSVIVKLDKKGGVGSLRCNVCATDYQTAINYLSGPVDVYADWVDACDEVKTGGRSVTRQQATQSQLQSQAEGGGGGGGRGGGDRDSDRRRDREESYGIDDDEDEAEADYGEEI